MQEKTDFFVDTKQWKDFKDTSFLNKVGQISSSQDIALSANASGRVASISVKAGDSVRAWQTIARLSDDIWSYGIGLERASIWVDRAQINLASNLVSLDKQIFDSQSNLDELKRNLTILKQDSEQNLIQAQDTLNNSDGDSDSSTAFLRIEQLNNSIEKSRLDLEIKITADQEQIESFKVWGKREFNSVRTLIADVIDFGDELLWITFENRNKNNDFEDFLWAQDRDQKRESEQLLQKLIDIKDSADFKRYESMVTSSISQEDLEDILWESSDIYETMILFLIEIEQTLNNSVESLGALSSTTLNSFLSQNNALQSQVQGSYGWFVNFKSSVDTFLRTYISNQDSIRKSIELQEKDRDIQIKNNSSSSVSAQTSFERTRLAIEDNIAKLEAQIRTAENNLENAQKNKQLTLRSLNNSIADARVNYRASAKEYNKLVITSPINGTIEDVRIDVWQEIFSWTELFDIVSDKTPEIEVSFSAQEREFVERWKKVYVDLDDEVITGEIYAISEVADANLNYKATIIFSSWVNIIWNLANLRIPISSQYMLLPLNIITTQWDEIWLVKIYNDWNFSDVRVRMWWVFWDMVEIVSCAQQCEELNIVTNDVSNYDENRFVIIER